MHLFRYFSGYLDGMLYVGSKKYILVSSRMNKLTTKEESQRMKLE